MTLGWMRFVVRRQILLRLLGVGAVLAGLAQLQAVSTTTVQAVGPKAYVGLFGEDAVAVIDTDTRQVIGKISIPPGPHGLDRTRMAARSSPAAMAPRRSA